VIIYFINAENVKKKMVMNVILDKTMTIYEQIQIGLDYIEKHLCEPIKQSDVAKAAGMSSRGFQNYFWMVTGIQFKKYLVKRRLAVALHFLGHTNKSLIEIALDIGYQDHATFTRSFKNEFRISPKYFRRQEKNIKGFDKIQLYKEKYMGIIIKELPEMLAIAFTGFSPEPENKAKEKLLIWIKNHPSEGVNRRIFGYNINNQGDSECVPENTGYKFLICINDATEGAGENIECIDSGKFLVTGIEGSFENDPEGNFIRSGWERMTQMIENKNFHAKKNGRWFEEELEPSIPGNLRLDLYAEIE